MTRIMKKEPGLSGHIEVTKWEPESRIMEITGLKGEFELKLYGPDGILKEYQEIHNLTVNGGFSDIIHLMGDPSSRPAAFQYCAVGTGTGAASTTDTGLGTEVSRSTGGFTQSGYLVWRNDATFSAGMGTGALTESGMFNATSGGTMLCRQTFAVINKGADDTLVVTWQYTLA